MNFENLIVLTKEIEDRDNSGKQTLIGFIKTKPINEIPQSEHNKIFIVEPSELFLDNLDEMSKHFGAIYPDSMTNPDKNKYIPIGQYYRDMDAIRDTTIEFQVQFDCETGYGHVNLLAGLFNDLTHKRGITVAPRYTFHRTNKKST